MPEDTKRRSTRQKALVEACLKKDPGRHMSVEDIVFELRVLETPVGKTTVYRTLYQMEDEGKVRRYETGPDGAACYSYLETGSGCSTHYHAVCFSCGVILHLESEQLDIMSRRLERERGFQVDASRTVVYGKCRECGKL